MHLSCMWMFPVNAVPKPACVLSLSSCHGDAFAFAAGMLVIGTAGTEEGLKLVREQGAEHVFNHRT